MISRFLFDVILQNIHTDHCLLLRINFQRYFTKYTHRLISRFFFDVILQNTHSVYYQRLISRLHNFFSIFFIYFTKYTHTYTYGLLFIINLINFTILRFFFNIILQNTHRFIINLINFTISRFFKYYFTHTRKHGWISRAKS